MTRLDCVLEWWIEESGFNEKKQKMTKDKKRCCTDRGQANIIDQHVEELSVAKKRTDRRKGVVTIVSTYKWMTDLTKPRQSQ